ncbi:MAG TPA: caspase family protein, partial [Thermoanaerobaculia bacterium]|nr:caspase family protein [Thermoanaerobaculia bacterium]
AVDDALLRELPKLFPAPDFHHPMDPSFEHTKPEARPENMERFNKFKALRNARLLTTEDGLDLYYIAEQSKSVRLTPLGQFYWHLADRKRIR